jgi:hypothetical protein
MERVIIDNCLVTKYNNGIKVQSINMARKQYPNLNFDTIRTISYGSKYNDSIIISQLCNGTMTFDEINQYYQ